MRSIDVGPINAFIHGSGVCSNPYEPAEILRRLPPKLGGAQQASQSPRTTCYETHPSVTCWGTSADGSSEHSPPQIAKLNGACASRTDPGRTTWPFTGRPAIHPVR